jgi:membrane dipeptidase
MTDPIALHASLLTLDSHIDIPWPTGPAFTAETQRRVDLPKLRRGHIAAAFFAAYVPQTRRSPESHEAAYTRAVAMLEAIRAMGAADGARLCRSTGDIEQAWRDGATAVIPAVENGHACAGDPARLRRFAELGARYMTLTHTGHNALSDSSNPRADLGDGESEHGGLSPLGREAVAEMNRLGMVIDISHVSKPAMLQAAALSRTPVVATHSCARALCDNLRNLDDEQLDALRDVGGVAQITAVPHFLRAGGKGDTVGVADFADHLDYAVRRIGLAHVGISSDFDGGGGFAGWRDAGESANLTVELARRGYGPDELAALWGGNFLRVLRRAEQGAA